MATNEQSIAAPALDAVGIVTSDLARSLEFYRLLGLAPPQAFGETHVEIPLAGGLRLMFDTVEGIHEFRPDWTKETGNQLSLAFRCAAPAEVDEIYGRVTEAGFHGEKEPWEAFWGQRYAQLRDPDGVPVDLYAPLDKSEQDEPADPADA
jgi:catechol 2,3-dioxygenase-like lactoylglutathione lyase family enzyme